MVKICINMLNFLHNFDFHALMTEMNMKTIKQTFKNKKCVLSSQLGTGMLLLLQSWNVIT